MQFSNLLVLLSVTTLSSAKPLTTLCLDGVTTNSPCIPRPSACTHPCPNGQLKFIECFVATTYQTVSPTTADLNAKYCVPIQPPVPRPCTKKCSNGNLLLVPGCSYPLTTTNSQAMELTIQRYPDPCIPPGNCNFPCQVQQGYSSRSVFLPCAYTDQQVQYQCSNPTLPVS